MSVRLLYQCLPLQVIKRYSTVDVSVMVVGARPRLRRFFEAAGVFTVLPEHNFFITVQDAVLVAMSEMHPESSSQPDSFDVYANYRPASARRCRRRYTWTASAEDGSDYSVLGEYSKDILATRALRGDAT